MRIDVTCDGTDLAVLGDPADPAGLEVPPASPLSGRGRLGTDVRTGARLPEAGGRTPGRAGLEVRVVGGPDSGRRIALGRVPVIVGRDPSGRDDDHLVVQDPSLSRRHARIELAGHRIRAVDLGSTNCTRLDDTEIRDAVVGPGGLLALGDSRISVERAGQVPAAVDWRADGTGVVNRPPPLPPPMPPDPIEPIAEPQPQPPGRIAWLAALLPALFGAGLAWRLHNPQFLLFMVASPLMLLGSSAGERLSLRRRRRSELRAYRRDRARQDRVVTDRLAEEALTRRRRLPDPTALVDIAALPAARLWEGTPKRGLVVRVGLATLDSELAIRTGSGPAPAGRVNDVPVAVDLAAGLGVCAPTGTRQAVARWIVVQLATRFSPAALELAVVVDPEREADWTWARWLPHVHQTDWVAREPEQWRDLAAELETLIALRGETRRADGPWTGRRLVVVVDAAEGPADLARLARALAGAAAVGVSALWLAPALSDLPAWCEQSLQVMGDTGARAAVTTTEQSFESVLVDAVPEAYADDLARHLAPLLDGTDRTGTAGFVPARLLDLLGLREADPARVGRAWAAPDPGLGTIIGTAPGGPVHLDLLRDGPHVLIAGTTGSGKSELLQSLVAGLAAGYPPDQVSFVLIDYKGGAAFGACARLPHVSGLVTDLDHHLTRRALRSLEAELTRRERLLAAVGVSDLTGYRASDPARTDPEPVPRLVIVVDEFAALADELPDFVTGLVGVAQRGRSLGVHLVLATQRPGGVVSPEIRANAALRIALRVTDAGESSEVIGTPDAAHITRHQPGRGFVARDGELTEVQVARISVPARLHSDSDRLRVVPLGPWRTLPDGAEDRADKTDLDLLCDAIGEAWRRSGRTTPAPPWLAPLPQLVTVPDLPAAESPRSLVLGLVDRPDQQCREPYELSLEGGGMLVAGASGSGRSTLLLSVGLGVVRRHPSAELYVIAPCAGPPNHLQDLPQCGTVARDAASVEALVSALSSRAEQRAHELHLGPSAVRPLHPLILLVDDYETVVAAGEEHDLGATVDRLHELLRAAGRAAVTVVVAGGRGLLVPRLTGIVSERLVLRLADPADYGAAGLTATDVPITMPPGRAVRVADGAEVALALPHRPDQTVGEAVSSRGGTDSGPPRPDLIRIRPLPGRVELASMPAPPPGALVLGRAGPAAAPCLLRPFAGAAGLLVAGPSRSGRSTTLVTLAMQARRAALRMIVSASHRSPLNSFAEHHDVARLGPDDTVLPGPPGQPTLIVIDDADTLIDAPAETAVLEALATRADVSVIAALRTEDLAVSFRGLGAQLRRARVLVLLQPTAADGELLGLHGRQVRSTGVAGRGLLLADPAWGNDLPAGPQPVQVAST